VISYTQRPIPNNTKRYQETDMNASGRIRICLPNKRAAAESRLRRSGSWHQPVFISDRK